MPLIGKTYSVGLDASMTSFGLYAYPINHSEEYNMSVGTDPKHGPDTRRVIDTADEIIDVMHSLPYAPKIVCIEDYGPINRTSGKVTQRAEMCGIIKQWVLLSGIPLITVTPNSLKKFATTKGNASKEDMLLAAHSLGFYANNADEADAFHAARLGEYILMGYDHGADFTRINPW
jgi:Holliday junction resolvasome RuvABC endonuclease subunit